MGAGIPLAVTQPVSFLVWIPLFFGVHVFFENYQILSLTNKFVSVAAKIRLMGNDHFQFRNDGDRLPSVSQSGCVERFQLFAKITKFLA